MDSELKTTTLLSYLHSKVLFKILFNATFPTECNFPMMNVFAFVSEYGSLQSE